MLRDEERLGGGRRRIFALVLAERRRAVGARTLQQHPERHFPLGTRINSNALLRRGNVLVLAAPRLEDGLLERAAVRERQLPRLEQRRL